MTNKHHSDVGNQDVEIMTLDQVEVAESNLHKSRIKAIAIEKPGVIDRMKKDIKRYGITASDLGLLTPSSESKPKIRPAKKVLYRNDDGETWDGGPYVKAWVKKIKDTPGGDIEKYRVHEDDSVQ